MRVQAQVLLNESDASFHFKSGPDQALSEKIHFPKVSPYCDYNKLQKPEFSPAS